MAEARDPSFTGRARKIFTELTADQDGKKMWAELKSKTPVVLPEDGPPVFSETPKPERPRAECTYFKGFKTFLKGEERGLVKTFKSLDLNSDEGEGSSAFNTDGIEVPVEEAFAQLGADLKEFDPESFKKDHILQHREFADLKSHLEVLKEDPEEFIKVAYNVKLLFPAFFKAIRIPDSVFQHTVQALEFASGLKDWQHFLELYEKADFVSPGEIQKAVPIAKEEWDEIFSFINAHLRGTYEHGKFSALAQAIKPAGYDEPRVTEDDYHFYIGDITKIYKKEKNAWRFVQRANSIKYLRVRQ